MEAAEVEWNAGDSLSEFESDSDGEKVEELEAEAEAQRLQQLREEAYRPPPSPLRSAAFRLATRHGVARYAPMPTSVIVHTAFK